MAKSHQLSDLSSCASFGAEVIHALRAMLSQHDIYELMTTLSNELGFRHFALIHHADLRDPRHGKVDIKNYPSAIIERLIVRERFRRDPIIRACLFADSAFIWSEVDRIIVLDRDDRKAFEIGAREGLNNGITVPYVRFGELSGSCTFAGAMQPEQIGTTLGLAQMVGVFAFQAARRLVGPVSLPSKPPHLHPRPRDCIVLAGKGFSNKQISRALAITPRTVDGYLTEARRLFDAHDRAELVVSAVLAGAIELHQLRRQPG